MIGVGVQTVVMLSCAHGNGDDDVCEGGYENGCAHQPDEILDHRTESLDEGIHHS